ncbi:hypothetical protein SteCoe_25242 [Stentor coeruleus]|uniref:PPM-type phosphatase domain-containing protein n=1 Tax=Stentor coeruleus TaxID=5963 RepID=A0A1R2BFN2_9CILI|nr:hypothetical protein SteCoe_25242 [Stentor coeruleus]
MERINLAQKSLAKERISRKLRVLKSISTDILVKAGKVTFIQKGPESTSDTFILKHTLSPPIGNYLKKSNSSAIPNYLKQSRIKEKILPPIPKIGPYEIPKERRIRKSIFSEKLNQTLMSSFANASQASIELSVTNDFDRKKISFELRTQIGRSQGKPKKENQDCVFFKQDFIQPACHFFSVCDGHGTNGLDVVTLVRSSLPNNIEKSFSQLTPEENYESRILRSLQSGYEMTENLLNFSNIEVCLSGCTSVSIIKICNTIYCANIGDSRAILGNYNGKNCIPVALTKDHVPGNEIEGNRIIKSGGFIDSLRDQEGNSYGPLRVWVKKNEYPGLAMTRCFGDSVSKNIGVLSEPEITKYELTGTDRFLVIASDGIWEYLSNRKVVKIVEKQWKFGTVKSACDQLMNAAVKKWNQHGEYMDDISFIIIFFKD